VHLHGTPVAYDKQCPCSHAQCYCRPTSGTQGPLMHNLEIPPTPDLLARILSSHTTLRLTKLQGPVTVTVPAETMK